MKPIKAFLLFSIFLLAHQVTAQNFGGNPSRIKWKQIKTPAARVIFSTGLDSQAARVATLVKLMQQQQAYTIGATHRQIPIVLQSRQIISNGYVQMGPYRSEYFITPPQNAFELGSQNWLDNLSIHEFRHTQQYSNYRVGLSKFFSVLLGQQGQALANSMSVPDWFFEGDAVWAETILSQQGRGRLPSTFNAFKSLYYGKRNYSFMRLRNGSFRRLIPNHYDLGYLMVAYGRERYTNTFWNNIATDAAAFKGPFYPWQLAVKRYTGLHYKQFTDSTFAYFQQQWKGEQQAEPRWLTNTPARTVLNYLQPYPTVDGSIIALKTGYQQIPTFVKRNANGNEEKIAVKDIGIDDYFSYNNGRLVYMAYQPNARWANEQYSAIRIIENFGKPARSIISKAKYFSPDINTEGDKIVAVDVQPGKASELHLLNLEGEKLYALPADSGMFFSHPKFLPNQQIVVAARMPNGFMGWLKWQPQSGQTSWLMQPINQVIGFPVVQNDTLFYSGTHGAADGIFSLPINNPTQVQLRAKPSTGAYQGYSTAAGIVSSVFTVNGQRLALLPFADKSTGISVSKDYIQNLYTPKTIGKQTDVSLLSDSNYTVSHFSKAHKIFNLHSWQPEISESQYRFSLLGENTLSSLLSEFHYAYNTNDLSHETGLNARYGGWYLQPYVSVNQTWNRSIPLNRDTTLFYHQTEGGIGVFLPLNFTFGKFFRSFSFNASVNNETVYWRGLAKGRYQNLHFNYGALRLSYSAQIQRAQQHIFPRFAYSISASYNGIINKYTANQFSANGSLFLPGIHNTHNLVLTAAYQMRDTLQEYIFPNPFPFSRGYTAVNFPAMVRFGANYHFPIAYPDWGFGNILYFQRIRMNGFYDFTQVKSLRTGQTRPFNTVGTELYVDTKWWNQLPVTIGLRYSRLLNRELNGITRPNQWEIILPIDLLPR